MKESIGGVSLFNIVIIMIVLFTGYVSLSINYSKAYNVKNEILNIIKNEGGVYDNPNFRTQITDYLKEQAYRSTHACQDGNWVGYTRTGELATSANETSFCVRGIPERIHTNTGEFPATVYYKVEVFYQLDLPILRNTFRFSVEGETSQIVNSNECEFNSSRYNWC